MTIAQRIEVFVRQWPGRTQREIAVGLFGTKWSQQRVNQDCSLLVSQGRIERRGRGGWAEPFRYYPA